MSNSLSPIIIIGLILLVVILFNFSLIARLKQNTKGNENPAMQSMLSSIRNPWKNEDAALDELAKLVSSSQDQSKEEEEAS